MIKAIVFITFLLFSGTSMAELEPDQFTQHFIEAFTSSADDISIDIIEPLSLSITRPGDHELTANLHNAYSIYLQDIESLDSVTQMYVEGLMDSIIENEAELSMAEIIPIVKDSGWLDEMTQAMIARGAEKTPEYYQEKLADGLTIFYAQNRPSSLSYLTRDQIAEVGADISSLREDSFNNLKAILPDLEIHGESGLYVVTADGNFEASLLLLDELWMSENFDVEGDIVISIPTRDTLLVSGADNKEQLAQLREISKETYNESPYYLTPQLYVRKNGSWEQFVP